MVMGRAGGLTGAKLAGDLESEGWKQQVYEVNSASEPPNGNWFTVEEFVRLVAKKATA